MKRLAWLIPVSFIMCGCPFESKVPLERGPLEPVDSTLLGYWYGIIKDGSDYFGIEALDITKGSDSVYKITRYGKAVKGDMILPDTAYFTGYTSYVGEQRFMNIESSIVFVTTKKNKPPEIRTEKIFYLATIDMRNDTLRIKTISEDFSVRKIYGSPEELKQMVITLTGQQKNIYDDQYSQSYRKIERPPSLR